MRGYCLESRFELYRKTLDILNRYNIKPRKRFSQNFIIDPDLINLMIKLMLKSKCKRVLEVGAGIGTLTKYLAKVADEVVAVEVDPKLVKVLRETLSLENVIIIEGDFLKLNLNHYNFDCIVSNTPFHISSKVLFKILSLKFKTAILSFQKEFAYRLIAKPGSRNYGRLTVMVQLLAEVKLHKTYPPTSFYPAPEVEISVVEVRPRGVQEIPLKVLEELLRTMFTEKNKLAYKPLGKFIARHGLDMEDLRKSLDSNLYDRLFKCRVKEFTPEEFKAITGAISRCMEGLKS